MHSPLGQRFLAGKGIPLPQAPNLAQAKVPGQSLSVFIRGQENVFFRWQLGRTACYELFSHLWHSLPLMGSNALAQMNFIGPGSTPQGDYLRGVGVACARHRDWQPPDSHRQLHQRRDGDPNQRVHLRMPHERKPHECRTPRRGWRREPRSCLTRSATRIAQHPEARDVRKGDALNEVLKQLNNPKIQESASRSNAVPLSVDEVRQIPFKLGAKGVRRFSIARLTAKGKGKWPEAFQDNRFDVDRRRFEKALDSVLEQQYKKDVQLESINVLKKAIDNLEYRLEQVVGKISDTLYFEARERLKEMRETFEMLKYTDIELALGELDRYAGTTVNDLRVFMLRHNLQFADADNPEERELFPQLYAKLGEQRDRVSQGLAVQDDAPKN